MIFFNGFASVGFKSAAWANGFLVPWLWLLMSWSVAWVFGVVAVVVDGLIGGLGFWCRGCGC